MLLCTYSRTSMELGHNFHRRLFGCISCTKCSLLDTSAHRLYTIWLHFFTCEEELRIVVSTLCYHFLTFGSTGLYNYKKHCGNNTSDTRYSGGTCIQWKFLECVWSCRCMNFEICIYIHSSFAV
jgi:hypothetical protein